MKRSGIANSRQTIILMDRGRHDVQVGSLSIEDYIDPKVTSTLLRHKCFNFFIAVFVWG